ncbi:MAG: hypothetical protein ABSB32_15595 [Thermodesulfobacteriota bacterium]
MTIETLIERRGAAAKESVFPRPAPQAKVLRKLMSEHELTSFFEESITYVG